MCAGRRLSYLALALFLWVHCCIGAAIMKADAQKAVAAWLKRAPSFQRAAGGGMYQLQGEPVGLLDQTGTRTLAFVELLQPDGFIVTAADDELLPILCFSEHGTFDFSEKKENHLPALIRADMSERLLALTRGAITAEFRYQAKTRWRQLLDQDSGLRKSSRPMLQWLVEKGPFLSSQWGQGADSLGAYVFNYYTPYHYVCGCVATAMMQVLYYYRWPLTGTGSHSYVWNNLSDPPQTLSADFGATSYQWDEMVDIYKTNPSQSDTRRAAVGQLASHCGISIDMDYADDGSGAYTEDVASALRNYFRMSCKWQNNNSDFFTVLHNNMMNSRPMVLSMSTLTLDGHAVVIDGLRYDNTDLQYYHLNMGWWSRSDAWYDISEPFTTGSYTWSVLTGAVVDIVPGPNMVSCPALINQNTFDVSWNVAQHLNAEKYELQHAALVETPGSFFDGAENGTENWDIDANWQATNLSKRTGSYAFRGYLSSSHQNNTMTLRPVKLESTGQLSYYWGTRWYNATTTNLEISTDGLTWAVLKSYGAMNLSGTINWRQEILNSELDPYRNKIIMLRLRTFSSSLFYFTGDNVGFFVDDLQITNCRTAAWTSIDDQITNTNQSVTVNQNGVYGYRVRAYTDGRWWEWSDFTSTTVLLPTTATVKVFLEGPLNSGIMSTSLRDGGLVPVNSPYSADPRSVSSLPDNIVDWILLEIRADDGTTVVCSRSCFVKNDGVVVDHTGHGTIALQGVDIAAHCYITIKQRNHIAVMSNIALGFTNGHINHDFTTGIDQYHNHAGAKQIGDVWAMFAGDADQDQAITMADYTIWQDETRAGKRDYTVADFRLDGRVTSQDYVYWYENNAMAAHSSLP